MKCFSFQQTLIIPKNIIMYNNIKPRWDLRSKHVLFETNQNDQANYFFGAECDIAEQIIVNTGFLDQCASICFNIHESL